MASFKAWLTDAPFDVVAKNHRAAAVAQAQQIPDDATDARFIVVSHEPDPAGPKDQRLYVAWRADGRLQVVGYQLGCLPEDQIQ